MSESFIDISLLKSKNNLTNSDYILSILEIALNKNKTEPLNSTTNTTRIFWEKVFNIEDYYSILSKFQPETIRKYSRILTRHIKDPKQIKNIIKENEKFINDKFKLLQIINGLDNFLNNNKDGNENFEIFLNNFVGNKIKKNNKDNDNYNKKKYLNNKRKNIVIDDETQSQEEREEEEEKEEEKIEKKENEYLNEILEIFIKEFPNKNKNEIKLALYQNSGNLKNTYLYLCNPLKNNNHLFLETDDYIIKNLKDFKYYNTLLKLKGREIMEERENFLLNNNNNKN